MKKVRRGNPFPGCIVNGKPYFEKELPCDAVFVGMERTPNEPDRYKKPYHPWYNLPCYETKDFVNIPVSTYPEILLG